MDEFETKNELSENEATDIENEQTENEPLNVEETVVDNADYFDEAAFDNFEATEDNNANEIEIFDEFEDSEDMPFESFDFTKHSKTGDKKSMSKGLKVFSLIMAAVIVITASCATGYFFGKNSATGTGNKKISLNLSSKPKNTDEMTAAEVYEKVNKSVVGIEAYNDAGTATMASGVVYSEDGYVVTNDHIYADVPSAKFKIYDYKGNSYDAVYVAGDSVSDLALLKVKSGKLEAADFGDSSELVFGENVVAIGRPSDPQADSSITKGIVSHTKRRMSTTSNYSARLIQTDSAINPGSSGGALVNMYGQVVGITSSKLAGVNYDSVGFAIPTVTMKRVVTQLAEKGKVEDRAKLGITYTDMTSVTAEMNNLDVSGLYVASVSEDSDLYGRVSKGDIITHVNGKEITKCDIMLDVIEESYAGDTITITVYDTKGKTKDMKVVLKANVGESSYTTESNNNSSSNPAIENMPNGGNGNDTFDFPDGE